VEEHGGVGRKHLAGAAGPREAQAQILAGIVGSQWSDFEAMVEARVQRAIVTECESLAKLGETDEDEREERATVPRVGEWALGAVLSLR
jgi:hypothetical protein